MKRFYLTVLASFITVLQVCAKEQKPNFSLKNKSDRTIYVTFRGKYNRPFFMTTEQSFTSALENTLGAGAIKINPGSEYKVFNNNVNNLYYIRVSYCEAGDNACQNNDDLTYHHINFVDDIPKDSIYYLKFSLDKGQSRLVPQEGIAGSLTPWLRKNIKLDHIIGPKS